MASTLSSITLTLHTQACGRSRRLEVRVSASRELSSDDGRATYKSGQVSTLPLLLLGAYCATRRQVTVQLHGAGSQPRHVAVDTGYAH
jgi:hypothetical protein